MKSSTSIVNIATALLAAQREMGAAKKGASNPYFKSKYADLGAVLEACKDLLNTNSVTILQPHFSSERGKFVETILLHISGEWVSSETEIVCSKVNDAQAQGSAISYARRYGLQSLLSMPAEDDDSEKTMVRTPKVSNVKDNGSITLSAGVSSVTLTATPLGQSTTKTVKDTTPTTPRASFRKPPPKATETTAAASTDEFGLS